nr:MAG TPA: hypothetical protein [Caudoviricetes sp.]
MSKLNTKPIIKQLLESEEFELGSFSGFKDSKSDYELVERLKNRFETTGKFKKLFEENTVVTRSYDWGSDFLLLNMHGKHKASEVGILNGRSVDVGYSIVDLELDLKDDATFTSDLLVSSSILRLDRFDFVSAAYFVWYYSVLEINQRKPMRPGKSWFEYRLFCDSSLVISSEVMETARCTFNIEIRGNAVIVDLDFTNLPNASIVIIGGSGERFNDCEIKIKHPDRSRITIKDMNPMSNKIEINGQVKIPKHRQ